METTLYTSDGHIQLILGPMFAGKTTELLRRIKRYSIANKRCMVVKYKKDTRYSSECVATHDQQMVQAFPCEKLCEVEQHVDSYDCIGIDEGQFYPDLVSFCDAAADKGKIVIVAALDGTFQRKPFGSVLELIPRSEAVTKLTAVCMMCQKDAHFSKRICADSSLELIGGEDKYMAVCRRCYIAENTQRETTPKKQLSLEANGNMDVDQSPERDV